MVWDARASHQRDAGEEKDVSDQPFVCDQFHTGNRLSFYASCPRSRGVISGFGNRTGPSYPLREHGVGLIPYKYTGVHIYSITLDMYIFIYIIYMARDF